MGADPGLPAENAGVQHLGGPLWSDARAQSVYVLGLDYADLGASLSLLAVILFPAMMMCAIGGTPFDWHGILASWYLCKSFYPLELADDLVVLSIRR